MDKRNLGFRNRWAE